MAYRTRRQYGIQLNHSVCVQTAQSMGEHRGYADSG